MLIKNALGMYSKDNKSRTIAGKFGKKREMMLGANPKYNSR